MTSKVNGLCPRCGAKASLRVVAWKLLDTKDELETIEKTVPIQPSRSVEIRGAGVLTVGKEKERIRVTDEEYETTYRCQRCMYEFPVRSSVLRETRVD